MNYSKKKSLTPSQSHLIERVVGCHGTTDSGQKEGSLGLKLHEEVSEVEGLYLCQTDVVRQWLAAQLTWFFFQPVEEELLEGFLEAIAKVCLEGVQDSLVPIEL